jgi:hypothetical protein
LQNLLQLICCYCAPIDSPLAGKYGAARQIGAERFGINEANLRHSIAVHILPVDLQLSPLMISSPIRRMQAGVAMRSEILKLSLAMS